jgi:hypothetical protein
VILECQSDFNGMDGEERPITRQGKKAGGGIRGGLRAASGDSYFLSLDKKCVDSIIYSSLEPGTRTTFRGDTPRQDRHLPARARRVTKSGVVGDLLTSGGWALEPYLGP